MIHSKPERESGNYHYNIYRLSLNGLPHFLSLLYIKVSSIFHIILRVLLNVIYIHLYFITVKLLYKTDLGVVHIFIKVKLLCV